MLISRAGNTKPVRIFLVMCFSMAFCMLAGCIGSSKYEVLVKDEAGEPVSDVTIQFCSDTECILGTTDDNGIAVFDNEAGSYTVHIFEAPEGYADDDTEYTAPAKPGRLTIVLK